MGRAPGEHLLQYRLVEKIGEGGMGSVWRAVDTTLDREAAVKVLPDGLARDAQFLARFEREAKLLASLSHPNLAAVYGVHEDASTRFLAMELVPGEDLSQRLQRGPLPLDESLVILGRIADALEAAHARGVVHRDLKPANVRLMPDGRVKVLDFGLAKSVERAGGGSDPELTATGVVLGTAPYMSPEQARGQPVDARTDVWSFGCVAWECTTGERPFRADSIPDLVVAILDTEPDWERLPPGTPPSLRRLLRRCLAKAPRQRLHHIADARLELEQAAAELHGAPGAPDPAAPKRRPLALAALVVVVLATLVALVELLGSGAGKEATVVRERLLADARFIRLTNLPGEELDASISPDGQFVAFLGDRGGKFEAYFGRIGAGEYVNVSRDIQIWSPKYRYAGVRRMGFRGDGDALWLGGGADRTLTMISLPGGQASPWLQEGVVNTDWSPDGRRIVYHLSTGGDPVFVADADGVDPEELPLPTEDGYHQHFPTWSPDGAWIYLARGRLVRGEMDLWRVRPDGSDLERLTEGLLDVAYPVPIDERTVLFLAEEPDGSGPWLWELDLETRTSRRALPALHVYKSLSASRDRRRLVATVASPELGLWTVPLRTAGGAATEEDVEDHPLPAVRAYAPAVHGDQLFYLSSIGGGDGLWRYRDGKSEVVWRASGPARLESSAAVSPDGTRLAIVVREVGRARLLLIDADGTRPQAPADDMEVVGAACWSPDGTWIAVGGVRAGKHGLYKIRVGDGHVARIHSGEAVNPVWSPDGGMIVFAGPQVGPGQVLQAVAPDGTAVPFPLINVSVAGERVRFLPDGSGLVVCVGFDPYYEYLLVDLEAGGARTIVTFDSSASMISFDITPDGETIVFDRQRDHCDVVLIERAASE